MRYSILPSAGDELGLDTIRPYPDDQRHHDVFAGNSGKLPALSLEELLNDIIPIAEGANPGYRTERNDPHSKSRGDSR